MSNLNRIKMMPAEGDFHFEDYGEEDTLRKSFERKLLDWEKSPERWKYATPDDKAAPGYSGIAFTYDESQHLIRIITGLRRGREKFRVQIKEMIADTERMVKQLDDFSVEMEDKSNEQCKKMEQIRDIIAADRKLHTKAVKDYKLRIETCEREASELKWLLKEMNKHPLIKFIRRLPWVRL